MQLFAIELVSFKNKCIFKIVIFYVLLATSWFVITTIPVLLSVLLPKVPRSIRQIQFYLFTQNSCIMSSLEIFSEQWWWWLGQGGLSPPLKFRPPWESHRMSVMNGGGVPPWFEHLRDQIIIYPSIFIARLDI